MTPEPRRDLPVPLAVTVTLPGGDVRREYAVNLSPGGICLHVREPLADDLELDLRIELPEGPALRTRARVLWSRPAEGAERFCETGLRFLGLGAAERVELLAWATQPIDRRR